MGCSKDHDKQCFELTPQLQPFVLLSQNPNPPRKVFCVGKVYRNEAISYKHLPEFFQVDGIIIDEKANLATLLGTIKEFYRKMGFDKVRFKPDFFPYTEPSAEITVFMESKQNWIELGGSVFIARKLPDQWAAMFLFWPGAWVWTDLPCCVMVLMIFVNSTGVILIVLRRCHFANSCDKCCPVK